MSESFWANQTPFTLREIVDATGGNVVGEDIEYSIAMRGVSTDSRAIQPNSLFVALRGERFDGHDFLHQVAQSGATVAVVEDENLAPQGLICVRVLDTLKALGDLARFHRERFDIPMIGVTGSYGKTTTRAFIAAASSPLGKILASRENFNNEIGVPQTLFGLDASHKAAIIEMGMRGAGQIDYLAKVAKPTIGVITNIGPQHIEMLGSLENIARAKAELIENLSPDGLAILPAEGDFSDLLIETAQKVGCRIVTFGTSEKSDFRVSSTRTLENGFVEAEFKVQSSKFKIVLPLPGAHNATNAAVAFAVAHELGIDLNQAARALENVEVPGARMRIVRVSELTILDDCYNAGPNSMRAALKTLRDFPKAKRRVAVLGAMKELGSFSEEEHRKIAQLATDICDIVLFVGEEFAKVTFGKYRNVTAFEDANEAANRVLDIVKSGDVVLVKGSRSVGLETVVSALAQ